MRVLNELLHFRSYETQFQLKQKKDEKMLPFFNANLENNIRCRWDNDTALSAYSCIEGTTSRLCKLLIVTSKGKHSTYLNMESVLFFSTKLPLSMIS